MNDSALKREGKEVLNFNKNRTKKQRARIFFAEDLKKQDLVRLDRDYDDLHTCGH